MLQRPRHNSGTLVAFFSSLKNVYRLTKIEKQKEVNATCCTGKRQQSAAVMNLDDIK
jgi:hypothetical protein